MSIGGTLLPALGFFNIYPMRYSYVADHFQYLASLGLISLLVALATRGSSHLQARLTSPRARSRFAIARWGMLALLLGALAGLTWQRQQAFQNPRALWTDTLAKNPGCMAAHIHLGRIASRGRNHVLAEKHYRDGLRLRTDDLETHEFETNLAVALAAQQRYPEAVEMFQAALARVPNYFEALNGLGNIDAREGRLEAAISYFERALAEQPHNGIVRRNLGTALSQTGQLEAAERELRRAAKDDPTSAPTQHTLAQILAMRGRLAEAEVAARAAVRLDPDFTPARKLIEQIERDPRRSRPLEPDR